MDETAGIYARNSGFLDRYVQLGMAQGRVISVDFPTTVEDDAEPDHELLDRIEAYLQGEQDDFADVTVAMTMPTTEREVLEKVREVPDGENATVRQITMMVPGRNPDDESDLTAVREALASNQTPIFIPTHRVRDGPSGMPADVESKLRSVEGL
jgi:methylated-DNA-[protein]-cysteine S-methyltransferase